MTTHPTLKIKNEERAQRETVYWALVLIWAGLVFGVDSLGLLPEVGAADAWNWVFFGAGLLGLLMTATRLAAAELSDPAASAWSIVWAVVLMVLGLSGLTTIEIGFPVILLLIGGMLLGAARLHR